MDGYLLGVYAEAVRVGTLGYDQAQDAFQFDYDAAWPALPRCRNGHSLTFTTSRKGVSTEAPSS